MKKPEKTLKKLLLFFINFSLKKLYIYTWMKISCTLCQYNMCGHQEHGSRRRVRNWGRRVWNHYSTIPAGLKKRFSSAEPAVSFIHFGPSPTLALALAWLLATAPSKNFFYKVDAQSRTKYHITALFQKNAVNPISWHISGVLLLSRTLGRGGFEVWSEESTGDITWYCYFSPWC